MLYLVNILREVWDFLILVSPWLLLGLFFAGLIHSFIGENFIRKNLGGHGFLPVIKATLFGIPLPVCSCSVIPIAAGLRKDGASKASTMSFLVSTPTTGIDSIFVTYAFLGWAFTIARPLSALIGGTLVGLLVYLAEKEKSAFVPEHNITHHNVSVVSRIRETFNYGFNVLPQDLSSTLLVGILIGGILSAVIPADFAGVYLSNPLVAYPLMILISVPIYVCAVGSVPIAAALLMKGLVPGAALAFLIAGPATNTVTISFVGKKLGKKTLTIYLISIIALAVLFGLVFDLFAKDTAIIGSAAHGRYLPYAVHLVSTIILLSILLISFAKDIATKNKEKVDMKYTFDVPDISCKHCKMTIEQALKEVPGIEKVDVSVDNKVVKVDGDVDESEVIRQIEKAGYTVKK